MSVERLIPLNLKNRLLRFAPDSPYVYRNRADSLMFLNGHDEPFTEEASIWKPLPKPERNPELIARTEAIMNDFSITYSEIWKDKLNDLHLSSVHSLIKQIATEGAHFKYFLGEEVQGLKDETLMQNFPSGIRSYSFINMLLPKTARSIYPKLNKMDRYYYSMTIREVHNQFHEKTKDLPAYYQMLMQRITPNKYHIEQSFYLWGLRLNPKEKIIPLFESNQSAHDLLRLMNQAAMVGVQ